MCLLLRTHNLMPVNGTTEDLMTNVHALGGQVDETFKFKDGGRSTYRI